MHMTRHQTRPTHATQHHTRTLVGVYVSRNMGVLFRSRKKQLGVPRVAARRLKRIGHLVPPVGERYYRILLYIIHICMYVCM